MPILANAKKALRVSERKRVINQRLRSQVKTSSDAVRKNPKPELLSAAFSAIDKAVKNNIFHRNKAARIKRQLHLLVKQS